MVRLRVENSIRRGPGTFSRSEDPASTGIRSPMSLPTPYLLSFSLQIFFLYKKGCKDIGKEVSLAHRPLLGSVGFMWNIFVC